jgi:hypothetical protein
MTQQELNGVPMDVPKMWNLRLDLIKMINDIDTEVVPLLPEVALPKSQQGTWPKQQYKKTGEPTVNALRYYGPDFGKDREYRTDLIVKTAPMNLASDKQVKEYLLSIGWKPTEWNFKKGKDGKPIRDTMGNRVRTSPKLTIESLESCDWPEGSEEIGKKIVARLAYAHRFGMINGWFRDMRADGSIEARVNSMGTPTGRMTHRQVVNVPGTHRLLGRELRECFTTLEGYSRIGIDLKSCQLRGLSNYMKDEEHRKQVIFGDPHQYTADIANLNHRAEPRQDGKKINFSVLFGASAGKVASDLKISEAEAKFIMNNLYQGLPALKKLTVKLEDEWKKKGFIVGLDGRAIWVRARHMLLVYLMQDLESVVMKSFIREVIRLMENTGSRLVTTMHDEVQFLVPDPLVDAFQEQAREAIRIVNERFNLWCPQDIDMHVGRTWAECH